MYHYHRCPKCKYIWKHGKWCKYDPVEHCCVICHTYVWLTYKPTKEEERQVEEKLVREAICAN
jgi:hypothetical protein